MESRKQPLAAVAMIGQSQPLTIKAQEGEFIAIDCPAIDIWHFLDAFYALPLRISCAGVEYVRKSFRYDENQQTAFYKVA